MKPLKIWASMKPKVKMTLIITAGIIIITLIIAAAMTGELSTLLGLVEKAKK